MKSIKWTGSVDVEINKAVNKAPEKEKRGNKLQKKRREGIENGNYL